MSDILIKGIEIPKDDEHGFILVFTKGLVVDFTNCKVIKAIELPSHEGTDLELYDYIKQGSSSIKLNRIASELSFLIHCEKEKKVEDVLGRLVAMRNAIWDSDKYLEKNNA